MTTLRDMPMISVEQKNRFREVALKVEAERDALAAHVVELVKGGRALHDELQQWSLTERDPETSAAMAKWRTVVGEQSSLSPLYRRDARMKAEALEELAAQPGMEHFTASRAAEVLGAAYRKRAATEAMDAIDGEDGDFANVRGVVDRMIAAGYRKPAEGEA